MTIQKTEYMKQIKIKYVPRELWEYFKKAVRRSLIGLFDIAWAIILLIVNILVWIWHDMLHFIKDKPVPAVLLTFSVMLVVTIAVHMSMKYKLTTAEWQRDSLEQKLDSIKELDNKTTSYYRYQSYD